MSTIRRVALASATIVAAHVAAYAQEADGIAWHKNWREAVKAAEKSGKCVWVNVWGPGCKWCKLLRDTTLTDEAVLRQLAAFESADMGVHENPDFVKKYKDLTEGFPRAIFLNSRGEVVYSSIGYMPAKQFLEELQRAQKAFALRKQLDEAPDDAKVVFELGHFYAERGMYGAPRAAQMAEPLLRKLLTLDADDRLGLKEDALLDLNISLLLLGKVEVALAGLESHAKAYPECKRKPERMYFTAAAYMSKGDYGRAKQTWQSLVEQFPDTIAGRNGARRLEAIRGAEASADRPKE